MTASPRIFGIAGWKNTGKTRMTAALATELTARGWRVSTVKHAHHSFEIDHKDTDSWQHRQAGAHEVAIISNKRWALIHELAEPSHEPQLHDILVKLEPCDIVLVEGYKYENHEKIEMRRRDAATQTRLAETDPQVVAIVSDQTDSEASGLPVFDHNSIGKITDFVERRTGLVKDSAA